MSADALNSTPHWSTLAWNQVRTLLMLQRRDFLILGVLVGAFLALALHGLGSMEGADHVVVHASSHPIPVLLSLVVPLSLVALLWPLGVWRHDPPAGRGYFWTLPAGRGPHTLLRVAVGWSMLMAVCLVVMVLVALVAHAYAVRFEDVRVTLAHGYVTLLSATLAYTLLSVLAVAVASPLRTIVWGALAVLGLRVVSALVGVLWISEALGWLLQSLYRAFAGPIGRSPWELHYVSWLLAGVAALVVVAFVHRES